MNREYQKLKKHDDYIENVFCNYFRLNYCDKFIELKKSLKKNKQIIEDKTLKKSVLKGASVVAIGAATGGLAYAFAPGIAVVLAGEAVAGLSGAALTSASLAFIGGGSIAAGGFGMAGGTAIITGGGAVLGLLGSGTVNSIGKVEALYENGITADACAKLLSYCKEVLIGIDLDYRMVSTIQSCLENNTNALESIWQNIWLDM